MSEPDNKQIPVIAYFSGWGMIYITKIEYGIVDTVRWFQGTDRKLHLSQIYTNAKGDSHFKAFGHTVPLSECIRCENVTMGVKGR